MEIEEEVQQEEQEVEANAENIEIEIEQEAQEEDNLAPDWVSNLRKKAREQEKELRELRKQIEPTGPGEKPKREDFDYDDDAYDQALLDWHEQTRKARKKEREQEAENERIQQQWAKKQERYKEKASVLGVKDFSEAEGTVKDILSPLQYNSIIDLADDPAMLVLALGRNPEKASQLSNIDNPAKFIREITLLETQKIKVRRPPAPASRVESDAPMSNDTTLNQLIAESEKSGDVTALMEYRRKRRNE